MKYDFNEIYDRQMSEKWMYDSVIDGYPVIPMSVADTDLVAPIEVRLALMDVCSRREFGYPGYHADFKDVLASWFERYYAWRPAEEDIIETAGLLMTMGRLIFDMTTPDQKTVLMTPVYHAFGNTIRDNHRQVIECDLIRDENNHYTVDFDALRAACARPDAKFLILCNPHNPIGRCWTAEEIVRIVEIAQSTDTILITDEIHGDFVYQDTGMTFTPVLKVAKDPKGIVMVSSGGKLFNIGGIFSSFFITADPELKRQLEIVLKELHFQPTAFAHEAAYAGYKHGHDYRAQVVEHIRKMQVKLVGGLNSMPYPVRANLPEATYLVWADFSPTGWTADQIQDFLVKDCGLGFNRGDQFGQAGARFARINCGVNDAKIDEALQRLNAGFAKHFGQVEAQ